MAQTTAQIETVNHHRHPIGERGFLQVERKRIRDGAAENDFLMVSRGFTFPAGDVTAFRCVTLPDDPDVRAFLLRALQEA